MLKRVLRQAKARFGSPLLQNPAPFELFSHKSRELGLDSLCIFLSFDCDTNQDGEVVSELCSELESRQMYFSLSVPGQTLQASAQTYGALARRGIEFMNHGFAPHTKWVVDHYEGRTFYSEMSTSAIENDIVAGHLAVHEVCGTFPSGFRTPHFGTFSQQSQRDIVYAALRKLGYQYSSSSLPQFGLEQGSAVDVAGLLEFPMIGSLSAPTTAVDSWTYLSDRIDYKLSNVYFEHIRDTLLYFQRHEITGLFSIYADPIHVANQAPFWRAMDFVHEQGIPVLSGRQAVQMIRAATVFSPGTLPPER